MALREPAVPRPGGTSATTPGPPSQSVLDVRDLHVRLTRDRRVVHAVRGVSLAVRPGEIVGMVGESGSGKSVLGLATMGLLPRRSRPRVTGTVLVGGTDMVTARDEPRRAVRHKHIGAVFQDPMTSLDPTMTVGSQLAEVTPDRATRLRLLGDVGVPDPASRLRAFPHQLSGGLRQRVMIALAVARRPSLIVADEPTTALDVTVQAQVLDLLLSLRDEVGCGVLFVTHDLGVAAQISDRMVVMHEGRLVEQGAVGDIFDRPEHPYTRRLLRSRIDLDTPRDRPLTRGLPQLEHLDADNRPTSEAPAEAAAAADRAGRAHGAHGRAIGADGVLDAGHAAPADQNLPERWPAPDISDTYAVRLRGVTRTFRSGRLWARDETPALRGVDLDVAQGEAVALVGESGCGKSTLLRIVAGLETATAGRVDVAGSTPQMVFQDAGSSLTPWLTVGDMLGERLTAHLSGTTRAARRVAVEDALRTVGLDPDAAHARGDQLSGGQRQRVAIARAVIVPPRVLLCDEPTSALDVSLAATVLDLLGRLRRELGMSILFVTHDLAAARIVADRVAVMRAGRIVEFGPTEQVCSAPAEEYTRTLLAAIPGPRHRRLPHDTTVPAGDSR
ncbi:ATP-binding cassette domain-containing protein [Streptomyces sp. NPDC127098]|uniref:ATP-binding cassette domain-containing protein n=1 Tax=Streptomyces sp. NPDC127098 TaxID=3347137 RepID=UPI003667E6BC